MYSHTLSLTSELDGVGGQRHAQVALPPGIEAVRNVQEDEWAPGQVWTGASKLRWYVEVEGN